jgi:hypothetical protein
VERAVDEELRFHFDMTMRELMASGMNPDDARREAERRFGDVGLVRDRLAHIDRQRVGQEKRAEWWSGLVQDIRYAFRGMLLQPGFAAVIVIALALGIGANAPCSASSIACSFARRRSSIAPERTHHLYFQRVVDGKVFTGISAQYQRFLDISESATTTEVIGAFSTRRVAVGVGEDTRELTIGAMSSSLWKMFNARPVLGRFFAAEEDKDIGGAHVVVLSHGYWQSKYAGSDSVLGKAMQIGAATYTIIGVAPRGFAATQLLTPSAFIPIGVSAAEDFGEMWKRYRHYVQHHVARDLRPEQAGSHSRGADRGPDQRVSPQLGEADRRPAADGAAHHRAAARCGVSGLRGAGARNQAPDTKSRQVAVRRRSRGAAYRLRQRRQPAAGAAPPPASRDRRAARVRRQPVEARPAVAHREPPPRCRRSG